VSKMDKRREWSSRGEEEGADLLILDAHFQLGSLLGTVPCFSRGRTS
jgi:hypothetical protein